MKAVIFDVDGVIVDVRESYHLAIKRTAEEFLGKEVSLDLIREIKYSKSINNDWDVTYEVIKHLGGSADYGKIVERFTEVYRGLRDREKQILSSGIFRELKERGVPLGIVTGRPKSDLDFVLDRFNLRGFFDVTVDEDDVADKNLRKPHPFPLHLCMETLGVGEALYVGDSPADLEMVAYYRKIYGKPVRFVHFRKVVKINLPADFTAEEEGDLRTLLLGEVCPNREGEQVSRP
ncbi:MAG: HAD-IA family hydrolase [Aquificota bacterium]|nr:HAD-IA family hydrolase [Aquificota bacterium]